MPNRPPVVKGDICKYHKKFAKSQSLNKIVLVVLDTYGQDTSEGLAKILVNAHVKRSDGKWSVMRVKVSRREIWKTGANVLDDNLSIALDDLQTFVEGMILRPTMTSMRPAAPDPSQTKADASAKKALQDWLEK